MESAVIQVGERLDRGAVPDLMEDLGGALRKQSGSVVVDLGQVEAFDAAGLGAVVEGMRQARARGQDIKLRGLSEPMLEFFSLVSVERLLEERTDPVRIDPVTRLGTRVEPLWGALRRVTEVGVQTAHAICVAPFLGRGKRLRVDRAVMELDQAANGALAIVILIGFLLGLVLAMQAYVQLRVWGAEIYMADMVAVSVTTEIGPLMTAIILAARSGSSNAAQLGSMVINEEVDALEQMGVHPVRFLVAPKVLALAFATVALGLLFDVVGMCGGALFGFSVAGIEPGAYFEQTRQALHVGEFTVGKIKCLVFGTFVGLIGCALGLRVTGGSEGVGRATTNAVVASIFLIIVTDAMFVTCQRILLG